FQEVVPLNVGNVLGAEDSAPVPKWEAIIRETLNRVRPQNAKFKCYSDPPSPSKFKPLDDIPDIEDELIISDSEGDDEVRPLDQTNSGGDEAVHPLNEEYSHFDEFKNGPDASEIQFLDTKVSNCAEYEDINMPKVQRFKRQSSVVKKVNKFNNQMEDSRENPKSSATQSKGKLTRALSGSERICLSWPEPPFDLLAQHVLELPDSFRSVKSFRASKSFRTTNSFKPCPNVEFEETSEIALLAELDLESIINRKRRSPFVRIASKQMVGVFISIWVRRSLRRHIRNLKVSTVGVGVMGYIGNKGSVSVSMSIYQTLFCFICTHLTSGEKQGDELRRNADVKEILRRTQFHPSSSIPFPKTIHAHERIIWFGDLNYRINLPYEKTRELISKKEWSKLAEKDQLIRELKKGRAFDGWTEGVLNFPPTYKFEFNSDKYCGEDPKSGRRNPAWCDRILSFGKGMRLVSYRSVEQMLSDHRPVKACYMAEVEIFCHKKLKKALALTDAELRAEAELLQNLETNIEISFPGSGKEIFSIKDLMMADF
ncbi:Type i inositol polyphosphate 5-phosphatase, partial [Thalictrum thalictroides]